MVGVAQLTISSIYCWRVPGKHRGGYERAEESYAASGHDASSRVLIPAVGHFCRLHNLLIQLTQRDIHVNGVGGVVGGSVDGGPGKVHELAVVD